MAESETAVTQEVEQQNLPNDLPAAVPYGQPFATPPAQQAQEPQQVQAQQPRPRDERGRYLPKEPVQAQVPSEPVEQPVPQAPPVIQHTPLTLHMAREFGIPEHIIASTPTADLRAEIQLIQARYAAQPQAQVQQRPAPVEEPFNWGINPNTNEPYKESDISPALVQMAKEHRDMKQHLAMLAQGQQQVQQQFQTTYQQQQHQASLNQFHALCDKNPEIFGKAQELVAGSPEDVSRRMMYNQLVALSQSGQHTTLAQDYQRNLVAFQRQPQTVPAQGRVSPEQWQQGALASPTHRVSAEAPKTRRQILLERKTEDFRRQGIPVPANGVPDDRSDLPPARPYGS